MSTKTVTVDEPVFIVKPEFYGTKKQTIKEIYESFNGWYWIITSYQAKKTIGYGFVHGMADEWGSFYMDSIKGKHDIWPVPKSNWSGISYVQKT